MKKWGLLAVLCIVLAGIGFAAIYAEAVSIKKNAEQKAVQRAKEEYGLTEIASTQTYYGSETYYIVRATNKKNEKVIVWIPKNQKKHGMIERKEKSGITKAQIVSIVQRERNPKDIKSVRLGMENEHPLWEVTYVDQDNSFTYYYADFQSGQFLKRYSMYE